MAIDTGLVCVRTTLIIAPQHEQRIAGDQVGKRTSDENYE